MNDDDDFGLHTHAMRDECAPGEMILFLFLFSLFSYIFWFAFLTHSFSGSSNLQVVRDKFLLEWHCVLFPVSPSFLTCLPHLPSWGGVSQYHHHTTFCFAFFSCYHLFQSQWCVCVWEKMVMIHGRTNCDTVVVIPVTCPSLAWWNLGHCGGDDDDDIGREHCFSAAWKIRIKLGALFWS